MQDNYISSRRSFLKGIAFCAGGYAVGSMLLKPAVPFAQSLEDNMAKIPMDTRWAIASGSFVYVQTTLDKALFDKVGQEEYNRIKTETGLAMGARNKKTAENFGFTGNDAKSVAAMASALVSMYYGPKQKFEIISTSDTKASVKCINCSYWDTLQAQKIKDDTCSAFSQSWWEGFASAMNPNMSLKLVKSRPKGDTICEWDFSLKT